MVSAFTSNQIFTPIDPKGISVAEFSHRMSEFFGDKKLIQIISTPMTGYSGTILEGLEKCKREGSDLSADKARKIWDNVAKRAEAFDLTCKLESQLFSLGTKEMMHSIIVNPSIEWIPGKKQSLATVITEAKKGAALEGLSPDMLEMAQKVVQAASKVELAVGEGAMFDVLSSSYDLRADLEHQFFENAELANILNCDLQDMESLLDQALQYPISFGEQIERCERQAIEVHGSCVLPSIARGYTMLDQTSTNPQERFHQNLQIVQADVQNFSENYNTELVEQTLALIDVDFSRPLNLQLEELALQIVEDHEYKIDTIIEFFLDDDNGFSKEQKEYVFYSKTLWPGYEDRGAFALFNPKQNDGPINQYDFYLTDAVWSKMLRMAEEVEEISSHNTSLLDEMKQRLEVDHKTLLAAHLRIQLSRYQAAENKEYISPYTFTAQELQSAEVFMQANV
jgi:hypothetical protein